MQSLQQAQLGKLSYEAKELRTYILRTPLDFSSFDSMDDSQEHDAGVQRVSVGMLELELEQDIAVPPKMK